MLQSRRSTDDKSLAVELNLNGQCTATGPIQAVNHLTSFSQSERRKQYSARNARWMVSVSASQSIPHSNRTRDCLFPNKTFKISHATRSLITRGIICYQLRNITFVWLLKSDRNHYAFQQSPECKLLPGGPTESLLERNYGRPGAL